MVWTAPNKPNCGLEQSRLALEGFQTEAREALEKLPPEPPPLDAKALTERQDALRACRGRLGDYERERLRHESLRDQLNLVAGSSEPERVPSGGPNFALLIVLGLVGVALNRSRDISWRSSFAFGHRRRTGAAGNGRHSLVLE